MTKLGFRTQLFLISMMLVLLVAIATSTYLERTLSKWISGRISEQMERHLEMSSLVLRGHHKPSTIDTLDPIADDLGRATKTHVILLDRQGRVLGDSQKTGIEITKTKPMDLVRISRIDIKGSKLTSKDDLELASRVHHGSFDGYVYMTFPLAELDLIIRRLRYSIVLAALIGLAAAILMSGFAAHLMTRTLRQIAERAHALARGPHTQMYIKGQDELGGLAISITHLATAMAESVEELAKERDRFEAVLESMAEAVIVVDEQRIITLTNKAALSLIDSQQAQRIREHQNVRITEVFPMPAFLLLMEDADEGNVALAELTLSGPIERVVMARVTPRTQGNLMVLHDVTALRRLERVRRDFVTNVSHELRTPVSVIMATSETLLQGALDDPKHAQRFITALHRNAERLSRLISDLLDISRIESGKLALALEPTSVFGAVLLVMDVLEGKIEAKSQEVDLDIDLELLVYADAKALDQILYNLIDNASKYTPQHGIIKVRAYTETSQQDEHPQVVVEVCDDGPGLTPEQRTRIFERFYRVDSGRAREAGGTGLGLAIVKHLTQAMKGRVGVKANTPKGSIFWLRLPLGKKDDQVAIGEANSVEILSDDMHQRPGNTL